jgi:hypothetical protein
VKRLLNHLHTEMVLEGYSEGHVHQENDVGEFDLFPTDIEIYRTIIVYRPPPSTARHSEGIHFSCPHRFPER